MRIFYNGLFIVATRLRQTYRLETREKIICNKKHFFISAIDISTAFVYNIIVGAIRQSHYYKLKSNRMSYSKNSIWIDLEYKSHYSDSKSCGLYTYIDKTLSHDISAKISTFLVWLKKRYFFPIRCNIFIENEKHFQSSKKSRTCQGIFFASGDLSRTKLPRIYVASDTSYEYLIFTIAHELTHYYQWYFYQDEKQTDRSLEIEANKYAQWLTSLYFNEDNDR